MKKMSDLKTYHKNPRKITAEDREILKKGLLEFGDLSGVVLNKRTGELVGGNQRTSLFKEEAERCTIEITEEFKKPTTQGTVAHGYIVYTHANGENEKFSYRVVDWNEAKEMKANLLANKAGGMWDFDLLANEFEIDLLREVGFKEFELGFARSKDEEGEDDNPLGDTAETYLAGNIKQIVLYFESAEYEKILPRMDRAMADFGVTSHTEAFIKLLDAHENSRS